MRFKKKHIKEVSIEDKIQNTIDTISNMLDTDEEGAEKIIKQASGIDEEVNEVGDEKVHTAKFDRCVADVKEKGEGDSAYPICQASLKGDAIKPSHQIKKTYEEGANDLGQIKPYKDSSNLELEAYLVKLHTELQYYTEKDDFNAIEGLKRDIEEVKGELDMRRVKESRTKMTKNELIESVKNDITKKRRVIKTVKVKDIK
jgi:hypothetical protein